MHTKWLENSKWYFLCCSDERRGFVCNIRLESCVLTSPFFHFRAHWQFSFYCAWTTGPALICNFKKVTVYEIKLDSDSKRIRQKFYQFFINEKVKKILYFFICILPNYVPHEITKEFWKNSHFEKMTAGFILRCQNWLRWNTPEKMHFQHWNFQWTT